MEEQNITPNQELFAIIAKKNHLKHEVNEQTEEVFEMLKTSASSIIAEMRRLQKENNKKFDPKFEYVNRNIYEFELRFSSDVLLFTKHTNIFEFSRNHDLMKTSYIKENKDRSYCGVIHIYNFLADSILYNRENDLGYLIGRVFVNKEKHCFIEGKQELGLLFNNFNTTVMTSEMSDNLMRSAMLYSSNFDLLTPPYDAIKEMSVGEIQSELSNMSMATGKRMGFKFQADQMV
ncbi:MAG: hypothetical protein RR256_02930 [Bacteroidales bacterium]